VRYSVNTTNKDELQEFLRVLARSQFNSAGDGNFLVTLAVSRPGEDKPLAQRTLMAGSRKSNKFLFFTTNRTDTGTVDVGGTMLEGISVTDANNNLKVSLRTYFSDKITYDTETLQSVLKLNDALKISQFLAIPAIVTGSAATVNEFVGKILSGGRSQDLTTALELQFIKRAGETTSPNRVRFTVRGYDWDNDPEPSVALAIDVRADTMRSSIGNYDPAFLPNGKDRKGFSTWAQPSKFLESAVSPVGKDKDPVGLFELVESSGPKPIAMGITMLRTGAYDSSKNGNTSISDFCSSLYTLIRKGFPERDAIGIYWDSLHRLKEGLSKSSGALACVKDKEGLFRLHGLPTADLLTVIKS
jgi:hypothetical protein